MSDAEHDWQRLLAAQRKLQAVSPAAVLVGGTAATLHLRHRVSLHGDHVLADLQGRFDEVLQELEATPGWRTARAQSPVLILGSMDGIPTGVRQLRRALHELMRGDDAAAVSLRRRALALLYRVPTGRPWFWLAVLQSLGEPIDWSRAPAVDAGFADI